MRSPAAQGPAHPVPRHLAVFVLILGCYYLMPFGEGSLHRAVIRLLIFCLGLAVVAGLVVWQVRVLLRGDETATPRIEGLLTAVYVAVVFFAAAYFVLARTGDGQFVGLATKTDALYFSLTTATTTGFGDIYAAGQAARALVSVQIVFDFALLGAAVAALRATLTARRHTRP